MKKKLRRQMKLALIFAAVCGMAAGLLGATVQVNAKGSETKHRKVKVAFPLQGGMSDIGANGDLQGYNYQYLQNIAEYAGWDLEYVTYDDMSADDGIMTAMNQIMDGEVDLLGPMLYSDQIAEIFEFPDRNYGVVYTTLCSLEKSNISTVNFTQCEPLRIAVYATAEIRNQEVKNYVEQLGIPYELIPCETTDEQIAKLESGEADVLSSITLSYFAGTRAVAEFAPRPYYLVSTKGNSELMAELDEAIWKLNYTQPDLQDSLQEEFFGDTSSGYVLTDDEKQYISQLESIKVLCAPDYAPYSYQNSEGQPTGAIISLLNKFAEDNEIKVEYTFAESMDSMETEWKEGGFDCLIGYPATYDYCIQNDMIQTSTVISSAMEIFGKQKAKDFIQSSVAVYGPLAERMNLTEFQSVVKFDSIKECIQAVEEGTVDYGCINQLSLDYDIFENGYSFVTTPLLGEHINVGIGVSNEMDSRFLASLNKYIKVMPGSTITTYISESNKHEDLKPLTLFMRTQPVAFTAIVVAILIAVMLLILVSYNANRYKKWNTQIQMANEAMQKATKAKSDFMSKMSHEIRTPLNAVIGYMTIAQMKDSDADKIHYCLENSELAAKHLLSIINDVLDVSAIESGKIKIARASYNLKQQLSTIATIFYNQAKNRDVDFQVHINGLTEEWVVGDQLRVNQIIMNLLSNAVKFTPENGHVTLHVTQLEKTDETVRVQFIVKDTGIGMSEEFLSRIFTPFEQESASTANKFGGTGLGLAISKNLTSLMGGTIEVDSRQNEGTTFTVTIPFGVSLENEALKTTNKDFSKIRVLVVDDQEEDQSYVKAILNRIGVKSDTVSDGKTAVRRFASRQNTDYAYDLCIIDWKMPEENGLYVAKQIREVSGDNIPIIIATAYDITEVEQDAKEAGIDQVITKPLFQSTLFDLLVNKFGKYEPQGEEKHLTNVNLQGATLLIAEDNEMNMEIAVSILSKAGIILEQALNGKEALEAFKDSEPGHYKAILMDVQMPVMNGYEASKAIRALDRPDAKNIPIIAMTANAFTSDVEEALSNGMNGHIAKPIDYEKLYKTLNNCIN